MLETICPEALIDIVKLSCALHTGTSVLDFGCGSGPHKEMLQSRGFVWTGLDYEKSMDPAALRRSPDIEVAKYDGRNFPFEDQTFDSVWSFQSLEHVFSPEETFSEIARVLKPNGVLFGSTSFLEAYHARSTFCFTPYGFKILCDKNGLELKKIFPSVDGLSLVFRYLLIVLGADETDYGNWNKMMKKGGAFFEIIRRRAEESGTKHQIPEAMAQVCGQFYFVAAKQA